MRRVGLFLLVSALGCGDDAQPMMKPALNGGMLALPDCGYAVVTRVGASAPVLETAQLGADPTPYAVHLGLGGDPSHTIAVQWRTRDDTTLATKVQLGIGSGTERTVAGLTFVYQSGLTADSPLVRVHEAHLCGLMPDTEYSYRVGGVEGTREVWSPTFHFRTAPDPARTDTQVTIAFLGDTRGGYDQFAPLLAKVDEVALPDLVVFAGDAVELGPIQSDWDDFFTAASPVLDHVPMVAAMGNHEVNAIHYYALFMHPGDEENYGLRYGPVHVTVLNDSPDDASTLSSRVTPFLDSDLTAAAGAPWSFVMHHRAQWSASPVHGSNTDLQSLFGPVIDAHAVDVVLNSHDHDYERTKPLRGGIVQTSTASGTVYLVSGGAGADLYDSGTAAWTAFSAKTHHFVVLQARTGMLDIKAYGADGVALDEQLITK